MDEVAAFLDGDKIPSLLVENKLDLLDEYKEDPNLEKFAKNTDFVDVLEHLLKQAQMCRNQWNF